MISLEIRGDLMFLTYLPDGPIRWVDDKLERKGKVKINAFYFVVSDLHKREEESGYGGGFFEFVLGKLEGDYFKIEKSKLDIKVDLYIHKEVHIIDKSFIAIKNISIFKKIGNLVDEDIYIGGNNSKSIPKDEFEKLLVDFPNSYELKKYADARIDSVLRNYMNTTGDYEQKYNKYMNKKVSKKVENIRKSFQEIEIVKYEVILNKLEGMLQDEIDYSEIQWQEGMLQIILFLYPKYIYVFKETPVKNDDDKNRIIDYLLVDVGGNVDMIEIKKPFDHCIITKGKYRNNFIPLRELSGTVMQVEKYIYYLNRQAKTGEKRLTEKYKKELPKNFSIKIVNPSGFIIMGRDENLSEDQLRDFEVVKRKYKNIIDILTYDDLMRRLHCTIDQLKALKK